MAMNEPGSYRPYRPSNGTEGELFMAEWCERCARDTEASPCRIIALAMAHGINESNYPAEWRYSNNGEPMCTAFTTEAEPMPERCDATPDLFGGDE